MRAPEFCEKCKQLIPSRRAVIGIGWIVCECHKKKPAQKIVLEPTSRPPLNKL